MTIEIKFPYSLAFLRLGSDMYLWTIVWFTALNDVQYEKPPIKTLQNVCRSYSDVLKL